MKKDFYSAEKKEAVGIWTFTLATYPCGFSEDVWLGFFFFSFEETSTPEMRKKFGETEKDAGPKGAIRRRQYSAEHRDYYRL